MKNGPRVWAFCKIEFPGIQKPVQFFGQKMGFFGNPGNRGVGVIWLVRGLLFDGLVVGGGWCDLFPLFSFCFLFVCCFVLFVVLVSGCVLQVMEGDSL